MPEAPVLCESCGTPIRLVGRTWRHEMGLRDRGGCMTAEPPLDARLRSIEQEMGETVDGFERESTA